MSISAKNAPPGRSRFSAMQANPGIRSILSEVKLAIASIDKNNKNSMKEKIALAGH